MSDFERFDSFEDVLEHDLTQDMLDADPDVQEVMPGVGLDDFISMTRALIDTARQAQVTLATRVATNAPIEPDDVSELFADSAKARATWNDLIRPPRADLSLFDFESLADAKEAALHWYHQAAQAVNERRDTLDGQMYGAQRRALQMAAQRINGDDVAAVSSGVKTLFHLAQTGDIRFA